MMDLTAKRCITHKPGTPPLSRAEAEHLHGAVLEWALDEEAHAIQRTFKFKDFRETMAFVNTVADLAEEENHHPDITISYSRVTFALSTHSIGGLSENDFILAAKIDRLHRQRTA